jgi:tRNA dimethylallyltransferase
LALPAILRARGTYDQFGKNAIVTAPPVILLAGPTASGKSRAAVALARRFNGVVINADSMQVYRELRILTARPSAADEAAAPHSLYGHVAAADRYSVGRWLGDIAEAMERARAEGRAAIIVGGTGLYFKALTEGLAIVPPVPEDIRQQIRAEAEGLETAALHERLARLDPEDAAAIRPSDRSRILRALDVFTATGQSLAAWQKGSGEPPLVKAEARRAVLVPERSELHRRISDRAEEMGLPALGEAEALLRLGLPADLPVMKAIGVAELGAHLRGDITLDEAVAALKTETRRYAKRQMTWFRNQMGDWPFVSEPGLLDGLAAQA